MLDLPHRERHRWVEEISKINRKINETVPGGGSFMGGEGLPPIGDPDQPNALREDSLEQAEGRMVPKPGGGFRWTRIL